MTIDIVIACAKCVPVIPNQRRRYGRIAEAFMATGIGSCSPGDIALCCLNAIVLALFCSLRICRRRRVVSHWLRMGASAKRKGKQQCCHRKEFFHDVPSQKAFRGGNPCMETSVARDL